MQRLVKCLALFSVLAIACTDSTEPRPHRALAPAHRGVVSDLGNCANCVLPLTTIIRYVGSPDTSEFTFGGDPAADYQLDVSDGGSQGANATLILNGVTITKPSDIAGSGTSRLHLHVALLASNKLQVWQTGTIGSQITVSLRSGVKTLDSTGGVLRVPFSGITLTVPRGALASATEVSVFADPTATRPPAVPPVPGQPPLPPLRFQPEGLTFSKPIDVAIPATALAGGANPRLVSYVHASGTNIMDNIPVTVDPTSGTGHVSLRHFSMLTGQTALPDGGTYWDIWWASPTVKFYLSPVPAGSLLFADLVRSAFARWQAAQSSVLFEEAASAGDANIVISEAPGGVLDVGTQLSLCPSNLALVFEPDTQQPAGGAGGTNGVPVGFSCSGWQAHTPWTEQLGPGYQVNIYIASQSIAQNAGGLFPSDIAVFVVRHEVGHALGLGHPTFLTTPSSAMMMQGSSGPDWPASVDLSSLHVHYSPRMCDAQGFQQTVQTALEDAHCRILALGSIADAATTALLSDEIIRAIAAIQTGATFEAVHQISNAQFDVAQLRLNNLGDPSDLDVIDLALAAALQSTNP